MTTTTASLATCAERTFAGGDTAAPFMVRVAVTIAETKTKGTPMSNDYTLPSIPANPQFGRGWMLDQVNAIESYGHACAEAARAPLLARIAELERSHAEFLDARRAWLASDAIKQSAVDRLRAELAREQKRRREIDDEAFEYADQVESLRADVEALKSELAAERADAERYRALRSVLRESMTDAQYDACIDAARGAAQAQAKGE